MLFAVRITRISCEDDSKVHLSRYMIYLPRVEVLSDRITSCIQKLSQQQLPCLLMMLILSPTPSPPFLPITKSSFVSLLSPSALNLVFNRIYPPPKCAGCNSLLYSSDLVFKIGKTNQIDNYHVHCLKCTKCGRLLQKGEEFHLGEGRILCRNDFEFSKKELTPLNPDQQAAYDLSNHQQQQLPEEHKSLPPQTQEPMTTISDVKIVRQDGRRGPKRPRTILTTQQRRAFKASFEISQKPCRKVCKIRMKTMPWMTGMIIQSWWHNMDFHVSRWGNPWLRKPVSRSASSKSGFRINEPK